MDFVIGREQSSKKSFPFLSTCFVAISRQVHYEIEEFSTLNECEAGALKIHEEIFE
jgi:hypothetical protein